MKDKHLKNKTVKVNKYKHKKSAWITQESLNSIQFRNKLYKAIRMSGMSRILSYQIKPS